MMLPDLTTMQSARTTAVMSHLYHDMLYTTKTNKAIKHSHELLSTFIATSSLFVLAEDDAPALAWLELAGDAAPSQTTFASFWSSGTLWSTYLSSCKVSRLSRGQRSGIRARKHVYMLLTNIDLCVSGGMIVRFSRLGKASNASSSRTSSR